MKCFFNNYTKADFCPNTTTNSYQVCPSLTSMLSEGNVKLTFETALKKCLKQFNGKEDCCILMYFDDIDKRKFIMNTLTKSLLCKHLFAVLTARKKDYDNDTQMCISD
jgi:hypothetical protein